MFGTQLERKEAITVFGGNGRDKKATFEGTVIK